MNNTDMRFFQANGQATLAAPNSVWQRSGTVGWRLDADRGGNGVDVRIALFEPLEAGYQILLTGLTGDSKDFIEPHCTDVSSDGFWVRWPVKSRPAHSLRFSFSISGLKKEPVMDDRCVSKDRLIEDVNALRLLFTHEVEYGFVTVMGSSSIESAVRLASDMKKKAEEIALLTESLATEAVPSRREELQVKLTTAERKLKRFQCLARPEVIKYWDSAKEFGRLWGNYTKTEQKSSLGGAYVPLATGAGPGIMTAAAQGAAEVGAPVVGIDSLFAPQNRFLVTGSAPEFHSAYLRCNDFSLREAALINFGHVILFWPGGYGTLWEVYETLTKLQTKHMRPYRVKAIFVHQEYWEKVFQLTDYLREEGTINAYGDRIRIPKIDDADPDAAYIADVADSAQDAFRMAREHVEMLARNNLLSIV